MTPQEQHVLDDFLQRLAAVHGVSKDLQADALIKERLAQQPDAGYLLVQRTLLLEQALEGAKQQIAQLEQQLQQTSGSRGDAGGASFLNAGLGASAAPAGFGRAPTAPSYGGPTYNAAPAAAQPQPAPTWRERLFGGAPVAAAPVAAGPSFLGAAAATAAGVAGGMFLFNGLENLMGHHNNANGFLGNGFSGNDLQPLRETVVENYTSNTYVDNTPVDTASFDSAPIDDGGSFFDDDGPSLI